MRAGPNHRVLPTGRHRPPSFAKGRTCAAPGCETVLSIYNDDERCAAHARPLEPGTPPVRPQPHL